jgi:hypothetical protein
VQTLGSGAFEQPPEHNELTLPMHGRRPSRLGFAGDNSLSVHLPRVSDRKADRDFRNSQSFFPSAEAGIDVASRPEITTVASSPPPTMARVALRKSWDDNRLRRVSGPDGVLPGGTSQGEKYKGDKYKGRCISPLVLILK